MRVKRSLSDKIDSGLSRNKRIVLFCLCSFFILGFQCLVLSGKILEVEPAAYYNHAIALDVTPEYRYGYVWTSHGAFFVKTPNRETPTLENKEDFKIVYKGLDAVMKRELGLIPLKAALEVCLYVSLLGYAFFGVHRLRMKFHIEEQSSFIQYFFSAATWMIFWSAAILPLCLFGYGEPLQSDVIGPGAVIGSPPLFSSSAGTPVTISYRTTMEFLTTPPLMLGTLFNFGLKHLPVVRNIFLYNLWILGLLFYGMAGMGHTLLKDELSSRKKIYRLFLLMIILPSVLIAALFPPWRPLTPQQMEKVKSFLQRVDPLFRPYSQAVDDFVDGMRNYNEVRSWPKTLPEAVQKALSSLSPEGKEIIRNTPVGDLIRFHHGWGTQIRNQFGLWQGNKELLRGYGSERMHPDSASMVIILAVWKELREERLRCNQMEK